MLDVYGKYQNSIKDRRYSKTFKSKNSKRITFFSILPFIKRNSHSRRREKGASTRVGSRKEKGRKIKEYRGIIIQRSIFIGVCIIIRRVVMLLPEAEEYRSTAHRPTFLPLYPDSCASWRDTREQRNHPWQITLENYRPKEKQNYRHRHDVLTRRLPYIRGGWAGGKGANTETPGFNSRRCFCWLFDELISTKQTQRLRGVNDGPVFRKANVARNWRVDFRRCFKTERVSCVCCGNSKGFITFVPFARILVLQGFLLVYLQAVSGLRRMLLWDFNWFSRAPCWDKSWVAFESLENRDDVGENDWEYVTSQNLSIAS